MQEKSTIKFVHSKNFEAGKTTYLLMHGYGCDEYDLIDGFDSLIQDLGGQWVSVRAYYPLQNGGYCWTYLPDSIPEAPKEITPDFQYTPEMLELSNQAHRALDALIYFIKTTIKSKVIPIGFSQGSMMSAELLREEGELVEKVVMLSGYLDFVPHLKDKDLDTLKIPTFIGYGDKDGVLPQSHLELQSSFMEKHTLCTKKIYKGMDHTIVYEELTDIKKFLQN